MAHRLVLFFAILMTFGSCLAQEKYVEGQHYQRAPSEIARNPLIQALGKEANGKVLVYEFFSYGCPGCFKVDPYIVAWQKKAPAYVDFQRVPVEFHPEWAALTKVYYTAKDLNALDKVHSSFFEAIQSNQITNTSDATLRQFFESKGIGSDDFNKTFVSFDVDRKHKWANNVAKAYRITAVPVLVVQGPAGIYVVSVRMAGSEANLIKVLDHLVEMEHSALSKEKGNIPAQSLKVLELR